MTTSAQLESIYQNLLSAFGPRHWWPADTAEEVVIGAILTQNVAWKNARKAMEALNQHRLLALSAIHQTNTSDLAPLIRSSRFYHQKAGRLKNFTTLLFHQFDGDLDALFGLDMAPLRRMLLNLNGFGPETVDSILLYAAEKPIFVIDAYTRRIFERLGLAETGWTYQAYQTFFMSRLPQDVALFNDYHAQIVHLGNRICKKRQPLCAQCPLADQCSGPMESLP
ncbi:MAG: endonuclease III domain-containing protein [Desulfobacterales bacterium]